jgi:hypothetical protein
MQGRMQMLVASRLCAAGEFLGIAGLAISLLALAALALADLSERAAWAWWIAALPGPLTAWLCFRVRIDARAFADLAAFDGEHSPEARAAAFDAALATFTGKGAAGSRTPADRARGARRLLLRLAVVVAVQFVFALVATFPGLAVR